MPRNIPLASSYPVVGDLTPRARRREVLREKAEQKKKENEQRMRAAAAKRARRGENNPNALNTSTSSGGSSSSSSLPAKKRRTQSSLSRASSKPPPLAQQKRSKKAEEEESTNLEREKQDLLEAFEKEKAEILQSHRDEIEQLMRTMTEEKEQCLLEAEKEKEQLLETFEREKQEMKDSFTKEKDSLLKKSQDEKEELTTKFAQEKKLLEDTFNQEISRLEKTQRELRNTILELKGNIRVFARVRPLLESEKQPSAIGEQGTSSSIESVFSYPIDDPDHERLILRGEEKVSVDGSKSNAREYEFKFDKVFREKDTQSNVFEEVSQLVQSALDGYRVCIFAYGQTGSGKTYTMDGDGQDGDGKGIIPRSVEHLFKMAGGQTEWDFDFKATFLEIYNETLRDLLQQLKDDEGAANNKYEIKHNPHTGETTVQGLTEWHVSNSEDLGKLMERARKARAVGSTCSNEQSSRSHSVFTLTIDGKHKGSGEQLRGVLNLVDLAGSERLSASKAQGQQLKETQAINKSLSCLGDVIFALANGNKHVPFRNSKLTYLLQNSLGGNSKTLMFVNLSPVSPHESLCSLRFGHKVNSCDIGTAKAVKKK